MPRPAERIAPLTSLRFFAALLIVIFHVRGRLWLPPDFLAAVPLTQGVSFFFVLSGFILSHVYASAPAFSAGSFYRARFARIWPVHAALAMIWLVAGFSSPFTLPFGGLVPAAVALLNLLMLHAWIPVAAVHFSLNDVSWSVSTEFFFYLAFPLIGRSSSRRIACWLAGSVAATVAIVVACDMLDVPGVRQALTTEVSTSGLAGVNPVARLWEFVLGIAAYRAWRGFPQSGEWSRAKATFVELASVAGAVAAMVATPVIAASGVGGRTGGLVIMNAASAPAFAVLIATMASRRGAVSSALSSKPLVYLGEISYVTYLVHLMLLQAFEAGPDPFHALPPAMQFAAYLASVIAVSSVLHHAVETPLRRLIRS